MFAATTWLSSFVIKHCFPVPTLQARSVEPPFFINLGDASSVIVGSLGPLVPFPVEVLVQSEFAGGIASHPFTVSVPVLVIPQVFGPDVHCPPIDVPQRESDGADALQPPQVMTPRVVIPQVFAGDVQEFP